MAAPTDADQDDRFALRDEAQIVALLQRMIDQRSLLDAPLPGSGPSLLTSVLAVDVDRDRLILDACRDANVERLALAQPQLAFSSRIDRVDVRFDGGPLQRTDWERLPAYAMSIPATVRHMQRREFFRIDVPVAHPIVCQLAVPADAQNPSREIRARVNDVSAGGLSLIVPPGLENTLQPGMRFATCRLALPDSAPVLLSLRIRRLFRAGSRGGSARSCAGCEFVDLSPSAETAIQRYMMKLERERIARERGRI